MSMKYHSPLIIAFYCHFIAMNVTILFNGQFQLFLSVKNSHVIKQNKSNLGLFDVKSNIIKQSHELYWWDVCKYKVL